MGTKMVEKPLGEGSAFGYENCRNFKKVPRGGVGFSGLARAQGRPKLALVHHRRAWHRPQSGRHDILHTNVCALEQKNLTGSVSRMEAEAEQSFARCIRYAWGERFVICGLLLGVFCWLSVCCLLLPRRLHKSPRGGVGFWVREL